MKSLQGKVAAVTGAGSGIGRATSVLLAQHGCRLALSDVNEEGLSETTHRCRNVGAEVQATRVDVADRDQVQVWADATAAHFGAVHVIVNNAGVALAGLIEDLPYDDFHWLMNINFWGVVHGTKAFLPHLRKAGEGHIVNVSSVFGLIGVPTQAAYNAAKFAVKGFTEALRLELRLDAPFIGVTTVHPGGIKTNIARNARMVARAGVVETNAGKEFEKLFSTSPERAAEDIVSAILKDRARQLIGRDAKVIDWMQRLLPVRYQDVVLRTLKKQGAKRRARANR